MRWLLMLLLAAGCRSTGTTEVNTTPKPVSSRLSAAAPKAKPRPPSPPKTVEAVPPKAPPVETAKPPAPADDGHSAASAGAPAPNPTVEPSPPVKAAVAPKVPKAPKSKVLIVGDSMAATDFGRALERRLDAHAALRAARRGKSSTGLARPDFFDWMSEAERQIKRHRPDLVVVIIGGNDGQDLIPKKKGRRVHWNKSKWNAAYARRVTDFAKLLMGEERRVAWLELPAMDRRRFERKLSLIRKVQKDALSQLGPRVQYVSTRDIFYDKQGRLKRKVRDRRGKLVALRQKDGIHFSLPGSHYFADRVLPSLLTLWSLDG
ncbi:MAG: DUF459 domain-containing protein [Myxococcota bacterium]